ncbi:unnamed protein product [Vitrella brassicaformis CCMP3155]|uniref:F-box domain-containing protein n=1 Tax=Vitrella brassicaformis (strain CCMP3155) TaxID=1169540 RepID=A0A0G4EEL7_VITBC|nr:unnamed protein product [Vitrella brassicaformis CCMP3155]|eukprot:CEL94446.1 unnamed protein product [Vitrella brassicaformis CCMP3155]
MPVPMPAVRHCIPSLPPAVEAQPSSPLWSSPREDLPRPRERGAGAAAAAAAVAVVGGCCEPCPMGNEQGRFEATCWETKAAETKVAEAPKRDDSPDTWLVWSRIPPLPPSPPRQQQQQHHQQRAAPAPPPARPVRPFPFVSLPPRRVLQILSCLRTGELFALKCVKRSFATGCTVRDGPCLRHVFPNLAFREGSLPAEPHRLLDRAYLPAVVCIELSSESLPQPFVEELLRRLSLTSKLQMHSITVTVPLSQGALSHLSAVITRSPQLHTFVFSGAGHTHHDNEPRFPTMLSDALHHCRRLRRLELPDNDMGAADMRRVRDIVRRCGKTLETLVLRGNPIGCGGIEELSAGIDKQTCRNLTLLDIRRST